LCSKLVNGLLEIQIDFVFINFLLYFALIDVVFDVVDVVMTVMAVQVVAKFD